MDTESTNIHPAEAYLRDTNNPPSLYVKIYGKRRRLFINRGENVIGIAGAKTSSVLSHRENASRAITFQTGNP